MIRQKRREYFFTFVLFCFYCFSCFFFCFVLIFCLNLRRNIQNERIVYIIQNFITIFYSAILIADIEAKNLRFFRYNFFHFCGSQHFALSCGLYHRHVAPIHTKLFCRVGKGKQKAKLQKTPPPLYILIFLSRIILIILFFFFFLSRIIQIFNKLLVVRISTAVELKI